MPEVSLAVNHKITAPLTSEDFTKLMQPFAVQGKLAIACSGGIDSLCLAYLAQKDFDITALIINHNLRAESAAEAAATSKILHELGVENHILSAEKEMSSNIQEQARNLRYDLLTKYCAENNIKFLATAHHADDNAETVLLRLSRGSGVDGLSAIPAQTTINNIQIIRPFLSIAKQTLEATLQAAQIKPVEDPTNSTDKYKRNKLRHALQELENAELITNRLNDTAKNMIRVRDFLDTETDKALAKCAELNKNKATIFLKEFTKIHDEIAYRMLVKIIMQLTNAEKRPRFEKIKNLKNDILQGNIKTLAGLKFTPQKNQIIITIEK